MTGAPRDRNGGKLSRATRFLARYAVVRASLLVPAAAVGALVGLGFVRSHGWGAVGWAALVAAVLVAFLSFAAGASKTSVADALADIAGWLLMMVTVALSLALVGAVVGLVLVPWQGWVAVPVGAAIGALLPLFFPAGGDGPEPREALHALCARLRAARARLRSLLRARGDGETATRSAERDLPPQGASGASDRPGAGRGPT